MEEQQNSNVSANAGDDNLPQIIRFLEDWAKTHHAALSFYGENATVHKAPVLITLPVANGDESLGAWDSANLMQEAEEAWNYQEPAPLQQILLMPTRLRKRTTIRKVKGKKNHAIQ